MDGADHLGLRQQQQVVVALELLRVVREARAAIVSLRETAALDHGAHGAVQDQDALVEEAVEQIAAVGLHGNIV